MRAHPICQPVIDRPDLQIDGKRCSTALLQ
jgi:hypothetical protein